MEEVFKKYKETDSNRYGHVVWEVSNYGNVRRNGKSYHCGTTGSGYLNFAGVCLHKIVAELFIGPEPGPEYQVDHIDTNKLNNHVDNLRWCTQKENQNNPKTRQHLSEANMGEKNGRAKKHIYNGIEFGCIKEAYDYAVKYDGYNKSYSTFYKKI